MFGVTICRRIGFVAVYEKGVVKGVAVIGSFRNESTPNSGCSIFERLGYRSLAGIGLHVFQNWNFNLFRQSQDGSLDVPRVESGLFVLLELGSGFKVGIGHHHGSELEVALVQQTIQRQKVQDVVSESTNASLLDGNNDAVVVCQLSDKIHVQWLHESGIRDGDTQVFVFVLDFLGGYQRFVEAGSKRQNGNAVLALLAPRARVGIDESTGAANDASLSNRNDFA